MPLCVVLYINTVSVFVLQLKALSTFDFAVWRQRYTAWLRAKKFRLTDFFRQNKRGNGSLTRAEFVRGMLATSKSSILLSPQCNVGGNSIGDCLLRIIHSYTSNV